MNEESKNCPECGKPIPPGAPAGLCPHCILRDAAETAPRPTPDPPPPIEEVAKAFPELEIISLVGAGGMGVVYKARQPKLDRFVALKLLAPGLKKESGFAERFLREARVLAKLSHPNIVGVHDFGEAGPFFYLLMEYVDGVNLRQAMRAGGFTPAQALAIVPKICDALQSAHARGVLHRDIKPENILLDEEGNVKIADFGIARIMGDSAEAYTLTRTYAALGSTSYMAPEQVERPHEVDHRADIYSLGVVFYEMLTGELPLGRFAAPSEKSKAGPGLDEVVLRTLEKERERRYQNAVDVRTDVDALKERPAVKSTSKVPATAVGSTPAILPRIVLVSLALVLGGVTSLIAGMFIIEEIGGGMGPFFIAAGAVATVIGAALGLWILYHMKRGSYDTHGRQALMVVVIWPLLFGSVFLTMVGCASSYQVIENKGDLFLLAAIQWTAVFLWCSGLLLLAGRPFKSGPFGTTILMVATAALFAGSCSLAKRIDGWWPQVNTWGQRGILLSSATMDDREIIEDYARKAAGPKADDYFFSFISEKGRPAVTCGLYAVNKHTAEEHLDAWQQRFTATFPITLLENWSSHYDYDRKRVDRNVERQAFHDRLWIYLGTGMSALLASLVLAPVSVILGLVGLISFAVLAFSPKWPRDDQVVVSGPALPPLNPVPLVESPDISTHVGSVQAAFDAAMLGDHDKAWSFLVPELRANIEELGVKKAALKTMGNARTQVDLHIQRGRPEKHRVFVSRFSLDGRKDVSAGPIEVQLDEETGDRWLLKSVPFSLDRLPPDDR